jgi:hypothetical protein
MAKITLTIADEKVDEFLTAFVADQPVPVEIDGEPLTPAQWYKRWLKLKSLQAYKRGRAKLTPVQVDEEIIQ